MRSDEIVAVAVPDQPAVLDDIIEEAGDVGGLDRCSQSNARPGAPAVEIGGDDELGLCQRIVVSQPRRSCRHATGTVRAAAAQPDGPGTRRAAGVR